MASKKYSFLVGLCLLVIGSNAQVGINAIKDSSVIPTKRMPQHTEFLNGTYNFPAKPRNQWEIGIKGGMFAISGDVPAVVPTLGLGAHVRKAFGYVFSMRLEYMYGTGKGLSWLQANNYARNPAWSTNYVAPLEGLHPATNQPAFFNSTTGGLMAPGDALDPVFYNYKTKVHDLSLQGVVTLNNIRFHKSKTGINLYGFGGVGATIYEARVNALNGNTPYDFSSAVAGANVYKNRKDTRKELRNILDDSYETLADNQGTRRPKLFGKTLKPTGTIGIGVAFKLSNRVNLAIEDRHTFTKDDLLDGQRWQEQDLGNPSLTRDFDSYNFASVGLNINLGAKSVEPLWWVNPLDYAYQEIRKPQMMILPKPVLPDEDGDGVTDQFDQEQTPAGCPVDAHGVSRDTDGDGIPDCKDKELVTPTLWQPVDADGVGTPKCPDSTCFENYMLTKKGDCENALGALPSISFAANSARLSDDATRLLAIVADRLRTNSDCKVVVTGYCASNKREQQRSWERVNAIITYLVEKEGIRADRMIFQYAQDGGDCDTVDIRSAGQGEEGPNTVPAPHPNLRRG